MRRLKGTLKVMGFDDRQMVKGGQISDA